MVALQLPDDLVLCVSDSQGSLRRAETFVAGFLQGNGGSAELIS